MTDFSTAINLSNLTDWMNDKQLGAGDVEKTKLLTGGTQNLLLYFVRGEQEFVLRRPPMNLRKNSNETMMREARILEALRGSDVPHPGFIAKCDDHKVLGASFYLMEPIDGVNPLEGLTDYHKSSAEVRRSMGFAMIDGILALSSVDYKRVGLEDFGKPQGFIDRQAPRWVAQLESYGEMEGWPGVQELPGYEEIPKWLDDNKPRNFQAGILHGDYHLGNLMYKKSSAELAAIVDWELCTIGDPLIDLGWIVAVWPDPETGPTLPIIVKPWSGFPIIKELVNYYDERSSLSLDELDWYGVLGCFKLGTIIEGTYARACAGKASMETGEFLHASTIRLFERALQIMSGKKKY